MRKSPVREGGGNRIVLSLGILLLLSVPLWIFIMAPALLSLPSDFNYKASVFSTDNFYDEQLHNFSGDTISNTIFGYAVIGRKDEVLLIKNYFSVRKFSGEKIIELQRVYGLDPRTGSHVAGYGDHDREGYLFAPRHLQPGQEFAYWHINYDTPAPMKFQDQEMIGDLEVYRYAADYHADQTDSLGHLPGVPDTRGVNLDVNLQLWVEPVTGRMIKYEDKTIAYYYNLSTGERLHPWNKFNNKFNDVSVDEQVKIAQREKMKLVVIGKVVPLLLGITAVALLLVVLLRRRK